MADNDNPLKDVTFHDPRLEYQEQQERKRLAFEAEQERKRQEFERRIERQKATRDWFLVAFTCLAVATAIVTAIVTHSDAKDFLNQQLTAQESSYAPYVSVEPIKKGGYAEILEQGPVGPLVRFKITVRGQTPAIAINLYVDCSPIQPTTAAKEHIQKKFAKETPKTGIPLPVLGEKDEYVTDCDFITPSTMTGIFISYSDVFSNQHHITYFFEEEQAGTRINVFQWEPPTIKFVRH